MNIEFSNELTPQRLDEILERVMSSVRASQEQIFEIVEQGHKEKESIINELEVLKEEIRRVVDEVDRFEIKSRRLRNRLAYVSRHFHQFSEADIRSVYEEAQNDQFRLFQLREKEQHLRQRREELQMRLKWVEKTVEKAETILTQVAIVIQYLSGEMTQLGQILENAQQQKTLGFKIILAQEEERKRVAREIHDGPAQTMANAVLRTEIAEMMLRKQDIQTAFEEIANLKKSVRDALTEVRQIIFDLRPMVLDDLGLVPTLRKYLSDFKSQHNIEIRFSLSGHETRLNSVIEVAVFRLVQECLSNVYKHAQANRVLIQLEYCCRHVVLTIIDDGRGFDVPEKLKMENEHFGLVGMKERVGLLGGSLEIQSDRNGTKLSFTIPLPNQGEEEKVQGEVLSDG
jgi:two-component system sensor histidine kinase DegS